MTGWVRHIIFLTFILQLLGIYPVYGSDTILWDTSHGVFLNYKPSGKYSSLASLLTSLGFIIDENDAGVLALDLGNYCLMVISLGSAWDSPYTAAEADKIETYVNNGGSLVIFSDNDSCPNRNVNPVADRFGVVCGLSLCEPAYLHCTNFISHPIFSGITSFYLASGGNLDCGSPSIPAALDDPPSISPVVALAEWGRSRFVTVGDFNLFENMFITTPDNMQFAESLFTWLCVTSSDPTPTITTTIVPTSTPTAEVNQFSRSGFTLALILMGALITIRQIFH